MLPTNLAELAAKQAGAFTWQQARLEYTRAEVRARVDRDEWIDPIRRAVRGNGG
jgi:hypothetical protein